MPMKKSIIDQEMEKLGWRFNEEAGNWEVSDPTLGAPDKEKYSSFAMAEDLPIAVRNAMIRLENDR